MLAAVFLAFLFLKRLLICSSHGRPNLPPSGPHPLPIIGHLYLLAPPVHQTLARISAAHGPVLSLRFGSRPVLLVSSPSAAEECLTKNDVVFANRPRLLAGEHLSYNHTTLVCASYSPRWRNLRRFAASEIFSSTRTAAFSSLREGEVRALIRQLFRHSSEAVFQSVELKSKFFGLTTNMIMQMIAGKRYYGESATVEANEGQRFQKMVKDAFHLSAAASPEDFLPMMRFLGANKLKRRFMRMGKEFDGLLQGMVDERRRIRQASNTEEQETVIDTMLSLQETEAKDYSDEVIKGMMMVLITGGTDTSAAAMEWTLSLLLNHPETLDKVRAEVDAHVGRTRLVTDADIQSLRYLQNVVRETLRLYPVGPLMVPHESSADCTVAGYDVPRGTMLLINAYAIQRDPNLWEDAARFKAERFNDADAGKGFKMIPFGYWRRGCPGELMANRAVSLAVGALVQCFEWKRVGEEEVVDMGEGHGLTLPKAVPLEAMYRPLPIMRDVLLHI